MKARWDARTARTAMFAAVCVLLSATGHVMMSGGVGVPWWALAAAASVAGGVGWCCTGRERGPVFVTTVTVATQLGLHSLFSLGQSLTGRRPPGETLAQQWADTLLCHGNGTAAISPADAERVVRSAGLGDHLHSPPPGAHSTAPHSMDAAGSLHGMGSMGHGSAMGMMHMGGHASYGMLAAHLLAALVCGLWLSRGERAAFRIGRALAARLFAPLFLILRIPQPPHRPRIRADRRSSTRRLLSLLLVHALTTRGPPHRTAVA